NCCPIDEESCCS
uniref:Conotoxin tx5h n=1 Tax=Conus textile TaxID=6494 RepID=CT5H_CONTE|nr:RecName: Full=Conotoxin tx5h; AltName: Full=Conotoxin Tx5.4 [Conus textile]